MLKFKSIYKYAASFIGVWALLFSACHKNNGLPDQPNKVDSIPKYTANVYVAGSTYDSVTYQREAAYWKNGVPVILTQGIKDAAANAIAVQGTDVYASGYITATNGKYVAVYWKNGVQTNLTGTGTNASAGSIAIQGNDVYITGFVEDAAVYWKNGQRVTLPLLPGRTSASTAGIAIQGTDIYVSGYQIGQQTSAVYWKNGSPFTLPNSANSYAGNNIVFQNGDMYMPASYLQPDSKSTVTNYWKNGLPVSLADGTVAINAIEMAVSGADVYVACGTSKGPGYYKNRKLTVFSDYSSEVTGIAVLNNDVYTSGQSTYQQKSVATFWKNGLPVRLFSSIGKGGFASAIVVTPFP
ncbi:hypothetical protein [Mucilaginibacter dorajii]|uniref:Bulb-type lectin domain-containing protein n=1 Tax=Mucilaginibacter dorajii TaxID=692994 RepID=A0ABP7Q861_9SPHI|nr:hypothetical protein [Mucilaginibacter dorajii]MCS3737194.1 hypothetical protein [Mucilaginibacter dorajii]